MDQLLTCQLKAAIESCLFHGQTVKYDLAGNGFSVVSQAAFVHTSQFIPLMKLGVYYHINCVFPAEGKMDVHFCISRTNA